MRWFCYSLPIAVLVIVSTSPVHAELTSPQIGWEAELNTISNNVSGTVSIVDEDTLQFDDFTYDGAGISVYFYLGTEDDTFAFEVGLEIGPQLVGPPFDGTQDPFTIDLPTGETMEGWNAISVWCVVANINFGSGTFLAPGDFDADGDVDGDDFLKWQRSESPDPLSQSDLADWEMNYGLVAPLSATSTAVPEPSTWFVLLLGMMAMLFRRDVVVS